MGRITINTMNYFNKFLLCLAVAWAVNSAPTLAQTQMLKVMVFNIEYGGYHIDFSQVIVAIKAADPDIILLEEADVSTQRVSDELGGSHPYFDTGMQLVSKYPLYEPHNSNQAYTFAEISTGKVVAISNIHLDDKDYGPYLMDGDDRLSPEEIVSIGKKLRVASIANHLSLLPQLAAKGYPVIIGGDFNAPSHLDYTSQAVSLMKKKRGQDNVVELTWPVSKAFEDAGFLDSYRVAHPDPVADPGLTWWAGKPFDPAPLAYNPSTVIQDRIDFLYSSGPVITVASSVVGESDSASEITIPDPWPSDHRAVLSTFSVIPKDMPTLLAVSRRHLTTGDPLLVSLFNIDIENVKQEIALIKKDSLSTSHTNKQTIKQASTSMAIDTKGLAAGDYALVLLEDNRVTAEQAITLTSVNATLTLSTDKAVYHSGEPVLISVSNESGVRWSSIEIKQQGGGFYLMDYTSHGYGERGYTETGTLTPSINNQISLKDTLPPGSYIINYYESYKPTTSITFEVK
ncbi:MAG: endonuclease/exonuclease/phosphatase family metal-dependent hydrolase [Halieaceae bacterium]